MMFFAILILAVAALPFVLIFVYAGLICSFFLNRNTPKPPKYFNSDERYWWYRGGWMECVSDGEYAYWTERAKLKHIFKSNKRFKKEFGYLLDE